jgi:hypothetical protein
MASSEQGTFREIVVPERIVLSALLDENGQKPRFQDPSIIACAERDGKTVVRSKRTSSSCTTRAPPAPSTE